jgi:molybdopterin-dependent oxidoreductase alpha subunit
MTHEESSPFERAAPEVTPPPTSAAGVPAIVSSTRSAARMGMLRATKTLLKLNQVTGFDCPGCAWPEAKSERNVAEFCENGAKHVADEATRARATPLLFSEMSVAELAAESDVWLNGQGRLTHPLVLREGASHYEPIAWDAAFALIAEEIGAQSSPDEAVFYTSGRTSNEAAFLFQLFARELGTNNLPDCSNMCHESSGHALVETLGWGKGSVDLDDFEVADAIFVLGQNPGSNHPRMLATLERAARRGAAIVSINPLLEPGLQRFVHPQDVASFFTRGTEVSQLYLQVRINGDVALLKGIMKEMLAAERDAPGTVFDWAFIDAHTTGYDDLERSLDAFSWERVELESGVTREEIAKAARVAMRSRSTIACWAMGLTQHKNSVATVREVINLLLLRGNVGRPGAGVCPVRGHSNVQGDRTMGIWERMPESFLASLERETGIRAPRGHGYDTVAAIEAMLEGRVRVFFAMGGNFLQAAPDTERTAAALRRCALTVHVSTKPSRAHLVHGKRALILPCLGRTERDLQASGLQFVTTEDSMGFVHASRGHLAPASPDLLSEPAIVGRMARAVLGDSSAVDWESLVADYDRVRDLVARVVPGFERYNERVREGAGFTLPHPVRERDFQTDSGKAVFTANESAAHDLEPDQLLMMTIRCHDQFNTTVYSLDDRYRGIRGGRRVVLVHEDDVRARGLTPGALVDLVGSFEGEERVASGFRIVVHAIPRGCAATYYPETNVLVPLRSYADGSRTPTSKSVVIRLRPSA